jgi:heme-degrading monooxygenase HmoA
MHVRVAFYKVRSGTSDQVVRAVEAPGGLLEIFRASPGFRSYELIEAPAGLFSVSHWETSRQADDATRLAARWVAEHIDDLVKLQQTDIGEVLVSANAMAATS